MNVLTGSVIEKKQRGNNKPIITNSRKWFPSYNPDYAFPPDALLKSLETAQPPYDRLQLILVSHVHLDHFDPVSVGLHLQNNKSAILVSSDQIADGVKKEFGAYGEIEPRIKRVAYEWRKGVALNIGGIDLKVLGLRHGGPKFGWVQNLGYVASLNVRKILHIGFRFRQIRSIHRFRRFHRFSQPSFQRSSWPRVSLTS